MCSDEHACKSQHQGRTKIISCVQQDLLSWVFGLPLNSIPDVMEYANALACVVLMVDSCDVLS